jgi:hypothetical protein
MVPAMSSASPGITVHVLVIIRAVPVPVMVDPATALVMVTRRVAVIVQALVCGQVIPAADMAATKVVTAGKAVEAKAATDRCGAG